MFPAWFSLSQFLICAFVGTILMDMYRRGVPVVEPQLHLSLKDEGLFWLGSAVYMWSFSGLLALIPTIAVSLIPTSNQYLEQIWQYGSSIPRLVVSTLNSSFLLLAVAFFKHSPSEFRKLQENKWKGRIIGIGIVVTLLTLVLPKPFRLIPDFAFSVLTVWILGYTLFLSFKKRNFTMLSALAFVSTAVIFGAQVSDILLNWLDFETLPEWHFLWLLASKTMVMSAILALPMSWAFEEWSRLGTEIVALKEQRKEVLPSKHEEVRIKDVSITVTGKRGSRGWEVLLTCGPLVDLRIGMPTRSFGFFLLFAIKRLRGEDVLGEWAQKDDTHLGFYSSDPERISENLGIPYQLLFENSRDGGYRLRIPAENLKLNLAKDCEKEPELRRILHKLGYLSGPPLSE